MLSVAIRHCFQVLPVPEFPEARTLRRFVILFPAYKEDRVIVSSVRSFLRQEYPKEMFDIIVISDQMQSATNELLRSLPIRLLIADYKDSSKASTDNGNGCH